MAVAALVTTPHPAVDVCTRRRVIALVTDAALRNGLSAAAGSDVSLTVCSDLASFEGRAAVDSADRVVLELGSGLSTEVAVRVATRIVAPSRILGICTLSPTSMREAAAAAHWGVTQLAIYGHDDLAVYLRAPTEEPTIDDVRAWLEAATRARADGHTLALLLQCLDVARHQGTVTGVADAVGVHRVTLLRQFRHLRLCRPKTVVCGYRVLLVAGLIEHTTHSVTSACAAVGFSSYAVFRRVLARQTRIKPRSLRYDGSFKRLTEATLDGILANSSISPQTPTATPQWTRSGSR